MKKKKIIIIVLIIIAVLVVLFTVRIPKQNKTSVEQTGLINEEEKKIVTDDFEIVLPAGWEKTTPAMGTSAMAVKINEDLNDPTAQKINFRSYFAVSYDTLQDKTMPEYLEILKNGVKQTASGVVLTKDEDLTINNKLAHVIEAKIAQQGADFKVLLIIITGQEKDVWVMSFNTTQGKWEEYKDVFYGIANSFKLKML
ncbi:MAG: hypothetical protein ABH951_00340 [Patescibacteria group bacterium]